MNIVGKILVIVNLLFALVTGGFLVVDFATRTNWKEYSDALKRELEVARISTKTMGETMIRLNRQVKEAQEGLEAERKNLADQQTMTNFKLGEKDKIIEEKDDIIKEADLTAKKAVAETDRFKLENADLRGVVSKRDQLILDKEEDVKKYRADAIANDNLAKTTQARNENLLAQIIELQREIARRDAGVGGGATGTASLIKTDPTQPNPPPVKVEGIIQKVNATDRTLVEVSLGSDHGLKASHTLLAYRLAPQPEYLGMIRLVEVHQRMSFGRLVRLNTGGTPKALQQGDLVSSQLTGQ